MSSVTAYLALGSNLGDRRAQLDGARASIAVMDGVTIEGATEPMETAPLDGSSQPAYLNAMVRVRTSLGAERLLAACHEIERAAGRARGVRWAPRTLDIDLVRHGSELVDRPDLSLPHPGLRDRPFWAEQLARLESDG